MKLYTKEQVLDFINFYESSNPRDYGGYRLPTMDGSERSHNEQTTKNILSAFTETITPIELPSDEEIGKEMDKLPFSKHVDDGLYNDGQLMGFELGAKWMKEQILNQNK